MTELNTLKKLKILIVEDHPIYRQGICDIVKNIETIEICDEAENGIKAIEKLTDNLYDIIFMDIEMPEMDGIEASKIIKNKFEKSKIIILTMSNSNRQIVELLEIGVNGYILKSTDSEELKRAINLIMEGNLYLTAEVRNIWSQYLVNKAAFEKHNPDKVDLSPRQKEIVFHLCQQQTAKEIAELLSISEATVNNHRAQIMKILNTKSSIGIALYAVKSGIFPL